MLAQVSRDDAEAVPRLAQPVSQLEEAAEHCLAWHLVESQSAFPAEDVYQLVHGAQPTRVLRGRLVVIVDLDSARGRILSILRKRHRQSVLSSFLSTWASSLALSSLRSGDAVSFRRGGVSQGLRTMAAEAAAARRAAILEKVTRACCVQP